MNEQARTNQIFQKDIATLSKLILAVQGQGGEKAETQANLQPRTVVDGKDKGVGKGDKKTAQKQKGKEGSNVPGVNPRTGRVSHTNGNKVRANGSGSTELYFVGGVPRRPGEQRFEIHTPDKANPNIKLERMVGASLHEREHTPQGDARGDMIGYATFSHSDSRSIKKFEMSEKNGITNASGRIFLCQIAPGSAAMCGNGKVLFRQYINPLCIPATTLLKLASTKQHYRWKKFKVVYTPGCPVTSKGQYGFGITNDPQTYFFSDGDANKRKFESLDVWSVSPVWEQVSMTYTDRDDLWYDLIPGGDPREFCPGELIIMNTITADTTGIGDVHLEYDVEFKDDTLINNSTLNSYTTTFQTNAAQNSGSAFAIANGNFAVAPTASIIYQVIPNTAITIGGVNVDFDIPQYGTTVWGPGVLLFMSYDTQQQAWYFTMDVPSPNGLLNDNAVIASASTKAGAAFVGTVSLYPVYQRNIIG